MLRLKLHAPSSGRRVVLPVASAGTVALAAAAAAGATGLGVGASLWLDGYELVGTHTVADVLRDGDEVTVEGEAGPRWLSSSSPSSSPSSSCAPPSSSSEPTSSEEGPPPATPASKAVRARHAPPPSVGRSRSSIRKARKRAARRRAAAEQPGKKPRCDVTRPAALAAAAAAPALEPWGAVPAADSAAAAAATAAATATPVTSFAGLEVGASIYYRLVELTEVGPSLSPWREGRVATVRGDSVVVHPSPRDTHPATGVPIGDRGRDASGGDTTLYDAAGVLRASFCDFAEVRARAASPTAAPTAAAQPVSRPAAVPVTSRPVVRTPGAMDGALGPLLAALRAGAVQQ